MIRIPGSRPGDTGPSPGVLETEVLIPVAKLWYYFFGQEYSLGNSCACFFYWSHRPSTLPDIALAPINLFLLYSRKSGSLDFFNRDLRDHFSVDFTRPEYRGPSQLTFRTNATFRCDPFTNLFIIPVLTVIPFADIRCDLALHISAEGNAWPLSAFADPALQYFLPPKCCAMFPELSMWFPQTAEVKIPVYHCYFCYWLLRIVFISPL